jgi:ABC transporter substrate binding protein/Bacterial extracellular solute-binding protein
MKRRTFIALLGRAAAAWPLAARAQQPATERTVGILMAYSASDRDLQARVAAFRQDLRKLGWVEGGNLRIDDRWPSDDMDRIRVDAAELIARKPDVILVAGRRAVAALQQQTRSVPVVFAGIGDPVEGGVVASFARPGGNFTGFTLWEYSMIGKMLEMLKQISPGMARAALVYNPDNPGTAIMTRRFQEFAAPLLCAVALQPAMVALIPDFEKSSGHKVTIAYGTAGAVADRVQKGEAADIVISSVPLIDQLQAQGKVVAGMIELHHQCRQPEARRSNL